MHQGNQSEFHHVENVIQVVNYSGGQLPREPHTFLSHQSFPAVQRFFFRPPSSATKAPLQCGRKYADSGGDQDTEPLVRVCPLIR
jgi:hypothetical protein